MSQTVTQVPGERQTVETVTPLENVLSTNNLTKHFGKIKAVNNLNLEVKRGQVFGMLGPNGSGKTTTLGMLMGVVNPTAGDFKWFGENASPEIRRKIGAVLEHPIFYPYLSGQKNLELNAMIKQCPTENISRVLEIVELSERRDDRYKTYSLGMKQRLAIASALLNDPTILILDEPTNGLDPMGIAEIRELIQKIAANGKTIILASHLLDEVQKVCTHFCVLKKGNLVHTGPVNDFGGAETVEVNADAENLPGLLIDFAGTSSLNRENGAFLVSLREGYHSKDLNTFLFEKGIVANHLVTRKKSLEKMFLEILSLKPINMILHLLKIDLKKMTSYRTFWVVCGLYFLTLGFGTASGMEFLKWLARTFEKFGENSFDISRIPLYHFPDVWMNLIWVGGLLKVLLGIMVIISVTNEFSYRTVRQNIIDGMSRFDFLLSKILTNVLLSLMSVTMIFLIGLMTGMIYSPSIEFSQVFTDLEFFLAYFLEIFFFLSYALMLSMLVQRSGLTIILLLLSQMIEAIIKANIDDYLPGIIPYFPMQSIWDLIDIPFPRYALQEIRDYVSLQTLLIVVAWTFLFNYFSYLKLKRSDI